jgi:hypothetical protein
MPRQTLIATALLVGISMLAMAAVVEFYSEDVRSDCLGPNCEIGYAYQKTWTKVWYDNSARKVVSHTGAAVIDSKGLYGYVVKAQGHPYIAGCVGDPWSGYGWMRYRLRQGRLVFSWDLCYYVVYAKFDRSICVLI